MNRPYIFCHMMTSLDGKIMGNYMDTPEGSAAGVHPAKEATSSQFSSVHVR